MNRHELPVLVVDDNLVNRLALEALLDRLGLPSDSADGGHAAVDAFQHRRFSIVLMDLVMPGVDGYEATRRIRRFEFGQARHTPIIAVTALGNEVEPACVAAGMDGLVRKPIDASLLSLSLRAWLEGPGRETATLVADHPLVERGPLDARVVAELYGSKNVQLMMATFLAVTRELIDEIATAINLEDEIRLLRTAHELKGAALQIRANDIAKLCLQIEEACRRRDGHEISAAYMALWHAFLRVKALVDRASPPIADAMP